MTKIAGRICNKCQAVSYSPPEQEREFHKGWGEVIPKTEFAHFIVPEGGTLDFCPKCMGLVTAAMGIS